MEKSLILSRGELQIFCKQTEPDFGEIRRVVLSVHGLAGSTEDAIQTSIAEEMEIEPGDIIQLKFGYEPGFDHTPVVTYAGLGTPETILVAANSMDALNRPLSTYNYTALRPIHIFNVNPQS